MHFFYSSEINSKEGIWLTDSEAHHAISVLRLLPGDTVQITDGKGSIAECEIAEIQKRKCRLIVHSVKEITHEFACKLHIAIAPLKSMDRFEWFLEKACELGVDKITPLICRNSERNKLNMEKCNARLIAAIKQSGRAWMPELQKMISYEKFIEQTKNLICFKGIAHCHEGEKFNLNNTYTSKRDMLMLIGPEGDFSKEEVGLAMANNYIPITLGNYRLRTETAAIKICVSFNLLNQTR